MKNKISRRSFLKKTGTTASLAAIYPLSISSILSGPSDDKRIMVIGAGLAGLQSELIAIQTRMEALEPVNMLALEELDELNNPPNDA